MKKFWENPANSTVAPQGARVPELLQIGSVRIAPATILAPMAGVTDTVFRRFIRNASFVRSPHDVMAPPEADRDIATPELHQVQNPDGREQKPAAVFEKSACGLLMTEFTSADGLFRTRESKRKRYLTFYEDEHPISAQLFGSDPQVMAEAARMVEGIGFDLIDLNLGCPAKKVVKCNGGSGLLRDLPAIRRIFEAVKGAVKIPFTVKFRAGWNDEEIVCVELAKMAEDCGLAAVALHARTREQGYSGNARWEWIGAIKDAVSIPVIGNGDIRSPQDACAMVAQTGCDAVMIGRTAPSNPWIFRQIQQYCAGMKAGSETFYDEPTESDRYQMIRTYFQMLIEEEMPGAAGKMKQFASWFTHGIPGGAALRKAIYESKSEKDILARVEEFFERTLQPT
jgi:nifR3 family TIM-barrel protein